MAPSRARACRAASGNAAISSIVLSRRDSCCAWRPCVTRRSLFPWCWWRASPRLTHPPAAGSRWPSRARCRKRALAPGSCTSEPALSCIAAGDSSVLLEVSDAAGNLLVRDVVTGDVQISINRPRCIRTATRSASGQLSERSELCGSELPARDARKGEFDRIQNCVHGVFQGNAPPAPATAAETSRSTESAVAGETETGGELTAEHGCSASQRGRASSPLALALAALALVTRRRRTAST